MLECWEWRCLGRRLVCWKGLSSSLRTWGIQVEKLETIYISTTTVANYISLEKTYALGTRPRSVAGLDETGGAQPNAMPLRSPLESKSRGFLCLPLPKSDQMSVPSSPKHAGPFPTCPSISSGSLARGKRAMATSPVTTPPSLVSACLNKAPKIRFSSAVRLSLGWSPIRKRENLRLAMLELGAFEGCVVWSGCIAAAAFAAARLDQNLPKPLPASAMLLQRLQNWQHATDSWHRC